MSLSGLLKHDLGRLQSVISGTNAAARLTTGATTSMGCNVFIGHIIQFIAFAFEMLYNVAHTCRCKLKTLYAKQNRMLVYCSFKYQFAIA